LNFSDFQSLIQLAAALNVGYFMPQTEMYQPS
jgi:hypothetical protein